MQNRRTKITGRFFDLQKIFGVFCDVEAAIHWE
jgi:hypothetical protein